MNYQNITYYKVVRDDLTHHGFTYKLGLNVDTLYFNPSGSCRPGGLYFTDIDNLGTFFDFGNLIAFIKIPIDAQVYSEPCGSKWKANRIIIEKFVTIDSYWHNYKFCIKAVKHDGFALQYVKNQSPEILMEAVKHDGFALQYVKNQSPEILMEAVKHDGFALQYVKNQSPELCLVAVKNGCALQYVIAQSPEILMEAVKENGHALEYVKEQSPEICLESVAQDAFALEYGKEQTPEICLYTQ